MHLCQKMSISARDFFEGGFNFVCVCHHSGSHDELNVCV